jgi:hypothetical protein
VVSAATGAPIGAMVSDGIAQTISCRDTGTFRFYARSHSLLVTADSYADLRIDMRRAQDTPLRVEMTATHYVRVRVRTLQGHAVAGAKISVIADDYHALEPSERVLGKSDEGGWFVVPVPGPVTLVARSDAATSEPMTCSGGEELILDPESTCTVQVVDSRAQPVACVVLATRIHNTPGARLSARTDATGRVQLPAGECALDVAGHRLVEPSATTGSPYSGVILELLPSVDCVLHVDQGPRHELVLRDARNGAPVAGSAMTEILDADGWRPFSRRVDADESGRMELGPIVAGLAGLASDYGRIRVAAPGFEPTVLRVDDLVKRTELRLVPRGGSIQLRFVRDDGPFSGTVCLRESAAHGSGLLLHDGPVGREGITLSAYAGMRIGVHANATPSATLLADIAVPDSPSPIVEVVLPRSARVVLAGAASLADVVAIGVDGETLRPQWEEGTLLFRGLFPGRYIVGPAPLVRGAINALLVHVDVASGGEYRIDWRNEWRQSGPFRGTLTLHAGALPLPRTVWVLPWRGAAPPPNVDRLRSAQAVMANGSFEHPIVPFEADRFVIFGLLGGRCSLLGEHPLMSNVRAEARHVIVDFANATPRDTSILLVAPPDARGRSQGQWLIPCSGRHRVDLGVVPRAVTNATIITTGRRPLEVELPVDGGAVRVTMEH